MNSSSTPLCSSMANRNISCKTYPQCSLPFFTRRRYMIASIEPDGGDPWPFGQIVRHDGQTDPDRKGFDGRDVPPGIRASRRLDTSRRPEFSGERLSIFAALYSRFGLD